MSQRLIHDTAAPWTPEEDAVLITCWQDPNVDLAAIVKMITTSRSAEAIQLRGYELGLGEKAGGKKKRKPKIKLTAWPDDMPRFEDHPCARNGRSPARAAKRGSQFRLVSHGKEKSLTGSSLDGASPQGLLKDE